MRLFAKISLAWLQLTHYKLRLVVALLGIAFAAVLIFVQLAFLASLYESQTATHQRLKADLVLADARLRTLSRTYRFPQQYLYRILNFAEVDSVNYLHYWRQTFKYGSTVGGKGIIILGINLDHSPLEIPNFEQVAHLLRTRDVVLFDRNSDLKEYGELIDDFLARKAVTAEVGERRVSIGGLVDFSGASFADDGNLIMSDATFFSMASDLRSTITVGLITVKPGVNQSSIIPKIKAQLPQSVRLMTKREFIKHEENYWRKSAPIGFVFSVGV